MGYLELIASGFCFGWLGLFGKKAFEAGIVPGEFLGVRFLFSAGVLGAILVAIRPQSLLISKKQILSSVILGLFGYAFFSTCYFNALKGVSASLTVLLLYTYPVMVSVGGRIFLGERLSRGTLWALPLTMVGLLGLVWGEWSVSSPAALAFGIVAAMGYAAYVLCSRAWLKATNPFVSTFYIQLTAGVVLSLMHFRDPARPWAILSGHLALMSGVAIVSSLLATVFFLSGLRRVTGTEASILSASEPLTGVGVAALFLGERMSALQIGGGVLVLGSMVILALNRRMDVIRSDE